MDQSPYKTSPMPLASRSLSSVIYCSNTSTFCPCRAVFAASWNECDDSERQLRLLVGTKFIDQVSDEQYQHTKVSHAYSIFPGPALFFEVV
jgi:hypothetical protein